MRPVHPEEILREELGLSANVFARSLDVPTNRITPILRAATRNEPGELGHQ